MANLVQVAFALLLAVNAAFALTCYQCDSSKSVGCNYGLVSFTYDSVDCSEGGNVVTNLIPKSCVKVVAKNKEGKEYVARGCMPSVGSTICNAAVQTAGFFSSLENNDSLETTCSTCDTDKCNSSQKVTATFTLVGLVIAVVAFLF